MDLQSAFEISNKKINKASNYAIIFIVFYLIMAYFFTVMSNFFYNTNRIPFTFCTFSIVISKVISVICFNNQSNRFNKYIRFN